MLHNKDLISLQRLTPCLARPSDGTVPSTYGRAEGAVVGMCLDVENCRWVDYYRKHQVPPRLREASKGDIDRDTASPGRASLFYPDVDQRTIEATALREGDYVESAKSATVYKVMEFAHAIGASEGESSCWVMVETTNGEYHGRPITRAHYQRRSRQVIECCE